MNRGGRAGEVPDAVDLELDRFGDIVTYQLETGMSNPLSNICLSPSEIVVKTQNLFTGLHQAINEMGTKKARTSCHEITNRSFRHSNNEFELEKEKSKNQHKKGEEKERERRGGGGGREISTTRRRGGQND